MKWLDKQVSFYKCPADNFGRSISYREILFTQFAVNHYWYLQDYKQGGKWINGNFNDLDTIIDLRTRVMTPAEKILLKNTMQCFTPAALLKTKKKDYVEEIHRTGIMQFDFDYSALQDYNIEEVKHAVFDLPFIGFCGLSCSGNGFYALALIEETDKLTEYAEHCFGVFKQYALPPDTTKGRNVQDLRFVSYDANMLIRENPKPLKIKRFKPKPSPKPTINYKTYTGSNSLVNAQINLLQSAEVGNRWATVQKVAYTLGGLQDQSLLDQIKTTINSCNPFSGEEEKYKECAEVCFKAGKAKPLD